MAALVLTALGAFGLALTVWLLRPAAGFAAAHLAFAAGITPLILGAMTYFVPVLTRGGAPGPPVGFAPWLAMAGGALAAAAFAAPEIHPLGIPAGAVLGLIAALGMLAWMSARARGTIGSPHPCLYWYLAAGACLVLALAAILLAQALPAHHRALRVFHLHLNLLGFVGLTALGTLQVLVPTAAGQADPHAHARLRRDLPWALAGVLVSAASAAWAPRLAVVGVALVLAPVARMAFAWQRRYRRQILARDGALPPLAMALAGYAVLVATGLWHAAGGDMVAAFFAGFLLPLVSGAASQLLPVWLRPGPQGAWHEQARAILGRSSAVRAVAFALAGLLAYAGAPRASMVLAACGLGMFLARLAIFALAAVRRARRSGDSP
jgi:hypothetical protein